MRSKVPGRPVSTTGRRLQQDANRRCFIVPQGVNRCCEGICLFLSLSLCVSVSRSKQASKQAGQHVLLARVPGLPADMDCNAIPVDPNPFRFDARPHPHSSPTPSLVVASTAAEPTPRGSRAHGPAIRSTSRRHAEPDDSPGRRNGQAKPPGGPHAACFPCNKEKGQPQVRRLRTGGACLSLPRL
jgi:hypothetical protein